MPSRTLSPHFEVSEERQPLTKNQRIFFRLYVEDIELQHQSKITAYSLIIIFICMYTYTSVDLGPDLKGLP